MGIYVSEEGWESHVEISGSMNVDENLGKYDFHFNGFDKYIFPQSAVRLTPVLPKVSYHYTNGSWKLEVVGSDFSTEQLGYITEITRNLLQPVVLKHFSKDNDLNIHSLYFDSDRVSPNEYKIRLNRRSAEWAAYLWPEEPEGAIHKVWWFYRREGNAISLLRLRRISKNHQAEEEMFKEFLKDLFVEFTAEGDIPKTVKQYKATVTVSVININIE